MSTSRMDIAIVGISAEFPSGHYADHNLGHAEFFKFLLDKGQAYERIPSERFDIDKWYGKNPGQVKTDTGAFLKDISLFDHLEFGIASRDAKAMTVGTRKLIEHSFLALMDSEIEYRGRNIGCYMSSEMHGTADVRDNDSRGSFAGYPYMVANKISYHLDLRGPSLPLHTACSSTAVAFHLAVEALRSGSCEAALIGGCQLNYRFEDWVQYSDGGVLSADGKCKPFDASADGFSRGEGLAVVVLKPLADAMRDGDHIYATVLGTNVNNPGNLAPVNAPVAEAQISAMAKAFQMAGRRPSELDYLELHATGTSKGDPTETNGIGGSLGTTDAMLVGSVKGNIGHLEISSFVASLSKVCSMFEHKVAPPNVNLNVPNPKIRWEELKLHVPLKVTPIAAKRPSGQFLMSIANYGISGVNVHVVLESPPSRPTTSIVDTRGSSHPILFVAAGLSPKSTSAIADSVASVVKDHPDRLDALAATYGRRSRQMTWKSFAVLEADRPLTFSKPVLIPRDPPPLVFVLSGQGPQHINMGRDLFKTYPVFRQSILEMDKAHERMTGYSLIRRFGLFDDVESSEILPDIWPVAVTHPSLTMFQLALVDLLKSFNIVPDAVVGHSAGETGMLYVSGRYNKEMAVAVATARGHAMSCLESDGVDGSMAAFGCDVETGNRIRATVTDSDLAGRVLEVACINSHDAITMSGHSDALDRAVSIAQAEGIFARKIRTRVAIHSEIMELCRDQYCNSLEDIFLQHDAQKSRIPVYSAVSGKRHDEQLTSSYYWNGGRGQVLFSSAIESILKDMPSATFLEIGPHPVLSSYLDSLAAGNSSVISMVRRAKTSGQEPLDLLKGIGNLVTSGHTSIDFRALNFVSESARDLDLPAYPFQRKHIPYHRGSAEAPPKKNANDGPLVHDDATVSTVTHPELAEHVIRDEPIMPATGYLEMAFEAGGRLLWDVHFTGIMALPKQQPLVVSIPVNECSWKVCSEYRDTKDADTRTHAHGFLSSDIRWQPTHIDLQAIQDRCHSVNISGLYPSMEYFAQWGPMYQRIASLRKGKDEALVTVGGADESMRNSGYVFHPALFDACIHIIVHRSLTENADSNAYYLPSGVDQVVLHDHMLSALYEPTVYVYVALKTWTPENISFDIFVTNSFGDSICELTGFQVAKHYINFIEPPSQRFDIGYQPIGFPVLSLVLSPPGVAPKTNGHGARKEIDTDGLSLLLERSIKQLLEYKKTLKLYILGQDPGIVPKITESLVKIINQAGHIIELFVTKDAEQALPALVKSYKYLRRVDGSTIDSRDFAGLPSSSADLMILESVASLNTIVLERVLVPGAKLFLIGHQGALLTNGLPKSNDDAFVSAASYLHHLHHGYISYERQLLDAGGMKYLLVEMQKAPLALDVTPFRVFPGNFHLFSFRVGQEIGLRDALKKYGVFEGKFQDIWIEATNDENGAAARGFCRSFQKELASTRLRLVLFQDQWSAAHRRSFVQRLKVTEGVEQETEILIDEHARILVPRVVVAAGPADPVSIGVTDVSWPNDNTVYSTEDYAIVKPTAFSEAEGGFRAFFGKVIDAGQTYWRKGAVVLGVVEEQASTDRLFVHEGQLYARPEGFNNVDVVLPLVHAALGVGLISLADRCRVYDRVVLVEDDSLLSPAIVQVLKCLKIRARTINLSKCPADVRRLRFGANIVLSGSTSDKHCQLLRHLASRDTHVYFWNSEASGLKQALLKDHWVIKDIFNTVLPQIDFDSVTSFVQRHFVNGHAAKDVSQSRTVLSPDKAYVLVGGIGSLGLEIAYWMYQNGARTLVLTSRSGAASAARNVSASRRLQFLQTLPGIDLRLVACDASSPSAMKQLFRSIEVPIAGCVLLAVVLSDVALLSHTEETYQRAVAPKTGAFKALQQTIDICKLDFLVTLSSAATFGNAGQTNYSSANTTVDELTRGYDNAFSLIAPAIVDTDAITHSDDYTPDPALAHWLPWAMTTKQVCDCLEDGIRKLKDGPFWLYIPDFNWNALEACFGPSALYSHLTTFEEKEPIATSTADAVDKVAEIVCDVLNVSIDEVSDDVPLSSYGLDSLSASKLSNALRPIVVMTQVQLLGNVGIRDIRKRVTEAVTK